VTDVLFRGNPRGERDLLLVPVLPGAMLRGVEPVEAVASERGRPLLPAICLAAAPAILITGGVLLFERGSGSSPTQRTNYIAAPAPPPAATVPAPSPPSGVVQHAPLRPPAGAGRVSKQRREQAKAQQLAAHLPVKLETTALLRSGSTVYAVGGTTRAGDPSDAIWQLDLRTGHVTEAGRFIEPLTDAAAAVRGGVLYLVGGWTGDKLATGILRWTPGSSSSLVTRLPVALRGATAAFIGGKLWVAGGSPRQVYEVDVDTGTLTVRTSEPAQLRSAPSNLEYLTASR